MTVGKRLRTLQYRLSWRRKRENVGAAGVRRERRTGGIPWIDRLRHGRQAARAPRGEGRPVELREVILGGVVLALVDRDVEVARVLPVVRRGLSGHEHGCVAEEIT